MANNNFDEFDFLRKRAKRLSETQGKQASQSLKRRFASLGGLQSGAYIKQAELQRQNREQQLGERMGEIGAQEVSTRRQQQELDTQRQFQSQEAEKNRQFARGERTDTQQFQQQQLQTQLNAASLESEAGRQAMKDLKRMDVQMFQDKLSQEKEQFNASFGLQKKQIESSIQNAAAQIGLQAKQLENTMILGMEQIGLDQQRINDARELGFATLDLNEQQMMNSFELGMKQQGIAQQQIDLAKDQFQSELQINKVVTGLNAITTIQELGLNSDQKRELSTQFLDIIGAKDLGLDIETVLAMTPSMTAMPTIRDTSQNWQTGR